MSDEKEEEKGFGRYEDNDLSKAQKIMKDNDIPFYHSQNNEDEEDNDNKDRKHTTH